VNPTLAEGELGLETDTKKLKVGDGSTAWNSLGYYTLGVAGYVIDSAAVFTGSIQEQTYALTDAATITIEPANGSIQYLTALGASRTIDVSNFVDGETVALMINDNSGAGSVTTWSTVEWVNNGGSAPAWPDSGNYTVVSLWKVNGTVYGALVGDGT
jgi:hypothetical protein